jgi:hypothetical protein
MASDHLQAVCMVISLGAAAAALASVPPAGMFPTPDQWRLLLVCFVFATLAQIGTRPTSSPAPVPRDDVGWQPTDAALAVAGAALCVWASVRFYFDWNAEFDRAWLSWVAGAILLGIGLDRLTGPWPPPQAAMTGRAWFGLAMLALAVGAAAVRLGAITEFPGPAGITQIEDLQFGNWGARYLEGDRRRWEFIGHTWISALSIAIGGAHLHAMRIGYALVGALTVVAVFLWLRGAAGAAAALIGAAFMTVSSWDAVVARIGFNPDVLIVAVLFALLVGPGRRGRPSAYVAMGLLSGYLLWEYIAYRPAVVFALAGGAAVSLRDRSSGWILRIGRPALILAMIGAMSAPLFGARLKGRVWDEYFNGITRARAQSHYYNDAHDWSQVIALRAQRSLDTVALLFFQGDASPARNLPRRPLVDPVSATLMLVGFAGCVAAPLSLAGLFAAAFVATAFGAMVVTADFNPLRLSVTIAYLYFFVGLAGAGILAVWQRAWGRIGRVVALSVLAIGLTWAAGDNITFLTSYWSSPSARRVVRNNLAYLCNWLGDTVLSGEQVVGVAGKSGNAIIANDAAWLRRRPMSGAVEWDVMTALHRWRKGRPTLLLVFAGPDTRDTQRFVETIMPGMRMTYVDDDEGLGGDLAFAHLPGRPDALDDALDQLRCRGVAVEYVFRGHGLRNVLERVRRIDPLVGSSTWPSEVVATFYRGIAPRRLEVRYDAEIEIRSGGSYVVEADFYGAVPRIEIDGARVGRSGAVQLAPGRHRFHAVADFVPLAEGLRARFLWAGPDSGGKRELIPFYEIAVPQPDCSPSVDSNEESKVREQ